MGNKIQNFLPTKREFTPLRETFQLNVPTTYENSCSSLDQFKFFIQQSSLKYSAYSLTLNSIDS